jgi:hypothetical protein
MSVGIWTPVVPDTANDIMLGEGVVYANDNVIGATKEGSELILGREIKRINFDGSLGETKGMRRVTIYTAKLKINFLKITYTNLAYGLPITVSDGSDQDGTYKKIVFDTDINSTDVLDSVSFRGYKLDGTECKIFVYNAINIDPIKWTFKSKDEVISPMIYTGFYAHNTPTTPPFDIWDYVPA